MKPEDLKKEYDKYVDQFQSIKTEIESAVVRTESYRGEYYELFPFSYQRGGFKRGQPVAASRKSKSTNNLFTYGFNEGGKIIEVREGIELKDKFHYQFLFYSENKITLLAYDYDAQLQNVSFGLLNTDQKIEAVFSKGGRGGREERYRYFGDELRTIEIRQFDASGDEGPTLFHHFEYGAKGVLVKIAKANDVEVFDVIYKAK